MSTNSIDITATGTASVTEEWARRILPSANGGAGEIT
jgi:hypothetical protein